jgi:predicted Fe-Mo cluster-binding NifX family protein
MKIAIPYQNGFVNDHFGHSENYAVFTINPENQIVNRSLIKSEEGCGCKSGIGQLLAREGVTIMLAGNIGAGAIHHLYTEGIEVVRGCSGPADEVVMGFLEGKVSDGGKTCAQHEGCGDHQH